MTKDEALDLALEALENSVDLVREDAYNAEQLYGKYPSRQARVQGLKVLADDHEKAITAIKQARALDKMADNARELGLDYEPVALKPTAQEVQNATANLALMREMWGDPNQPAAKVNAEGFIVETGLLLSPGTLLYTTPPAAQPADQGQSCYCPNCEALSKQLAAQRQWVGLTLADREQLRDQFEDCNYPAILVDVISDKLKEKNT